MTHKYFSALAYSLFGGGVATTCLGFINYYGRKNAKASFDEHDSLWDDNWDRRQPSFTVKSKVLESDQDENDYNEQIASQTPTATRNIILIRHGHYNLKGETDKDKFLTELGRKQAEETGLRLKALNLPYTKFIHSTMTRAIETADIIRKHLPHLKPTSTDLLCEGSPIRPDPPPSRVHDEKYYYRDGARIEAAFRKYFHRAKPSQKEDSFEIVVCHANVIRYFVCRALQFPPEAWLRFSLHHCSITWLTIMPNGQVFAYVIGDCGHLPKDFLTTSRIRSKI